MGVVRYQSAFDREWDSDRCEALGGAVRCNNLIPSGYSLATLGLKGSERWWSLPMSDSDNLEFLPVIILKNFGQST